MDSKGDSKHACREPEFPSWFTVHFTVHFAVKTHGFGWTQ